MKESGVALIMVLLVTSLVSTLALGLAVIVSTNQLAAGNFGDSTAMSYAVDAGVELAAHDLAQSIKSFVWALNYGFMVLIGNFLILFAYTIFFDELR